MKYEVQYRFTAEWYTFGVYDSMLEAKQAVKRLRNHMRSNNGRLLGKTQIKEVH